MIQGKERKEGELMQQESNITEKFRKILVGEMREKKIQKHETEKLQTYNEKKDLKINTKI